MRKIFNVLCVALLVSSCKNYDNSQVFKIDIEKTNSISDMIVSNECIPLETTDESLMADVYAIKKIGSYYVIADRNYSIFIFDTNGHFINKINRCGRGPGEYERFEDYEYKDSLLYILHSSKNEVLVYNNNGDCVRSIDVGDWYLSFKLLDDGKILLYSDNSNDGHYNFVVYDEEKRSVVSKFDYFQKNVGKSFGAINTFNQVGEDCFILKPYDYTIYKLNPDSIIPYVSVDYPSKYRIQGDKRNVEKMVTTYCLDLEQHEKGRQYKDVVQYINYVTKVGSVIYIYYNLSPYLVEYLSSFNIETGEIKTVNINEQRSTEFPLFALDYYLTDGEFICIMEPHHIHIAKEKQHIDIEVLNQVKDSDNPVLIVSKLR